MLTITTLASGSEGNCLLVAGGGSSLLIDAGISCRRIFASLALLGQDPAALDAVLITHEHSDHISGLPVLAGRLGFDVFASRGTAEYLSSRRKVGGERLRPFAAGDGFSVGALEIRSFPTSHDASDSVGYRIECLGASMALATDLGRVTDEVLDGVLGCGLLVAETNHDRDLLRSGPYPPYLQQRILGPRGHLCNEDGAALAAQAAKAGAKNVVLAHLSRQNNTPELALGAVHTALAAAGLDGAVGVDVAPRSGPGKTYVL